MRQRFKVQYELGSTPIEKIDIPINSRDELPPVLRSLQHIYSDPELSKMVFDLLTERLTPSSGSFRKGRPGMSFWEILVLSTVRLTLDIDYDRLEYVANYDSLVRSLLGICSFEEKLNRYPRQTLIDNVSLFDEELLKEINDITAKAGHKL